MMKFLIDEDVYADLVDALTAKGMDVSWANHVCHGAPDKELVRIAQEQGRTIITGDKGYGERVFVHGDVVPVILLRLSDLTLDEAVPYAVSIITSRDDWHQFISTITSDGVRMRPLPIH